MSAALPVAIGDVEAAATRIAGRVRRTPVLELESLGLLAKCESFQTTGAFKMRGATNAVLALRPRGVVTASSGNHGKALAQVARDCGLPCVVVMPEGSTAAKRAAVERLGAEVVDSPPEVEARTAVVQAIVAERGHTFVPAYDHPLVIAGQGTCGLEIAAQAPDVAVVLVPLGGGGLLSGIAIAVRARLGSGVRIVGVEPEDGDDFVRSRARGTRVAVAAPRTICDGARTTIPGELTYPVVEALVDDVVTVSDGAVVDAMRALAGEGLVVEPTAALGVAGAVALGLHGALCVVTGRNIDPLAHARLITPDAPG